MVATALHPAAKFLTPPGGTRGLPAEGWADRPSAQELVPRFYEELRRLAAAKMAREPPGQTLQATALVHEAYLRLAKESKQEWRNQTQFFAVAAEAMRRILVDRARRRQSRKRGGDWRRTELDWLEGPADATDSLVLGVHSALAELEAADPVKAEVVKLKFFVGLTTAEIAALLGVNEKTVRRHWSFAKAWMLQELGGGAEGAC